jgi:hypothetical protein
MHASAVCTQNIAKIRPGSNLIRSFAPRLARNAARWLSLARSYQFLERLELLSAVEAKIKDVHLAIKNAT